VVGTVEVTASSNTAKQRFADISPNCASMAKSMTPSGRITTKSPRCRIASRSTPHGENVPKFQFDPPFAPSFSSAIEFLKAKSMTPSGRITTKSPRCRIASRSTPHGENVPKFQFDPPFAPSFSSAIEFLKQPSLFHIPIILDQNRTFFTNGAGSGTARKGRGALAPEILSLRSPVR
jgi:hypothetical protein